MERTEDAALIPTRDGAMQVHGQRFVEVSDKYPVGNALHDDVIGIDCQNICVYGTRPIAMIGLQDIVVMEADSAILVGDRDRVQDVAEIVGRIRLDRRNEATAHREVYHPRRAYDSIDNDERFPVKHVAVKPGASLNLQMHCHRAEHWMVVSDTAQITVGYDYFLTKIQSSNIPPRHVWSDMSRQWSRSA